MADEGKVISISTVIWEEKITEYAVKTGTGIREALYEEWPLLMRKVMDFTPPFKTRGQPGSSDLSVGRRATERDIYKTMRPFNPGAVRSKKLEMIIEKQDYAAFNILASRSHDPRMAGARAIPFSEQTHLSQRDRRGRVNGPQQNVVVLGTDAQLLKRYVAKRQAFVGVGKSGWLAALYLVGGDAPGYVAKQGMGAGSVIDDHANEDNPSITAINHSPWAVRGDEGERILADAKASRIVSIINKIKTKERLARNTAGLKSA